LAQQRTKGLCHKVSVRIVRTTVMVNQTERLRDAAGQSGLVEIEAQLFRPSPRYLLGLFSQPSSARRDSLAEAADWFGLNAALAKADPTHDPRSPIESRWLQLLRLCGTRLESESEARELRALVVALEVQARRADNDGKEAKLDELWKAMSHALRAERKLANDGKPDGMQWTTLRGRKWGALRRSLARALAGAVARASPVSMLPRMPRQPPMFDAEDHRNIRSALDREKRGSGLAVITAPPGSGRMELALSFATKELQEARYDQVFVLRATDGLRLEQDFLAMAAIVTGATGNRADLRRGALRHLENIGRWLIVFTSVRDPAILLPFMPWNPDGDVLCTYWPRGDSLPPAQTGPWMQYFNVEIPASNGGNGAGDRTNGRGATIHDPGTLLSPFRAARARAVLADVLPSGAAEHSLLGKLAGIVSASRHATALARAWLQHTASDRTDEQAGVRQLESYLHAWDVTEEFMTPPQDSARNLASKAPEYLAGVHAALILLRELDAAIPKVDGSGWRRQKTAEELELEGAALKLLTRLEPFAASTFPVALLDMRCWTDEGGDKINDKRIELLDELALVDRAVGARQAKYFEVAAAVLDAVWLLPSLRHSRSDAVAVASRTMLRTLKDLSYEGVPPELAFELIPHAQHLADEEARLGHRPLVAVELHGRAALCHLTRRRLRTATTQLDLAYSVLAELERRRAPALRDGVENWQEEIREPISDAAGEQQAVDPAAKRMGMLIMSLRTAGFPEVANELFERLEPLIEEPRRPGEVETDPHIARLWFEAAMVQHDVDRMGEARRMLATARAIWEPLGNERWLAASDSFSARLMFDEGQFADARRLAEKAEGTRVRLLDTAATERDRTRMRGEVARSQFLRGRIAYCEGRLHDADALLAEAATAWQRAMVEAAQQKHGPTVRRINLVVTRSFHGLMRGLLGHIEDAQELAMEAKSEVEQIYDRPHPSKAAVFSNAAHVQRISGNVDAAADDHRDALAVSKGTWGDKHRTTVIIRRKYADSLLDAGRPGEAVVELGLILPDMDRRATRGRILSVARTWTSLGRLLVENSMSIRPLVSEPGETLLTLAVEVLTHAKSLYHRGNADVEYENPGMVTCLLGLSEVAIRRRESDAETLARQAYDLALQQYLDRDALPMMTPRARLIRARAIGAASSADEIELLRAEVDELPGLAPESAGPYVYFPPDRLEIALARFEILSSEVALGAADADSAYRNARGMFDDALQPLLLHTRHQLAARAYAELAVFADRFLGQRQRARNERERDRLLPPLEIDLVAITKILGAQQAIEPYDAEPDERAGFVAVRD
jgi:hypothetical protein